MSKETIKKIGQQASLTKIDTGKIPVAEVRKMSSELIEVTIYTDGACYPNPGGPGGYGITLLCGDTCKEQSGGFRSTTNNRMEVYAAIKALEMLKTACSVTLYSDSLYLINAMTRGWLTRWEKNGWRRNNNGRVSNIDLWERISALCSIRQVRFVHVKGHNGHYYNERCDALATQAMKQGDLPADVGYEHRTSNEDARQIAQEGQPCRKCSTPVIKRTPQKKPRPGQEYFFEYYLYCPGCKTMYMVEEAKRYVETQTV